MLRHILLRLIRFLPTSKKSPFEGVNVKIPVVFAFWGSSAQSMRSEPFGVARAACFEELACVFASSGALHYARISCLS